MNCIFEKEFKMMGMLYNKPKEFLLLEFKDPKLVNLYLESEEYLQLVPTIAEEFKENTLMTKENMLPFIQEDLLNSGFK